MAVRWMENDKKVGHNKTIKSHKKMVAVVNL